MDNEFFMNPSIQSQEQSNNPFSWQNTLEIQTNHSQDYFLSTPPQMDHFESALSSIVSSPVASNSAVSTDNFIMGELIGKLGNICNSNDMPHYITSANCSTNNSCYTTPLSSPPKIGLSLPIIDHLVGNPIGLPAMPGDPGFAERAARFSSFGSRSFNGRTSSSQFVNRPCSNLGGGSGKMHRVCSSPSLNVGNGSQVDVNGSNRKRKSTICKGKGKDIESHSQMPTNSNKVGEKGDESKPKKSKSEESNEKSQENKKTIDPQKDYIHVRARRGQATDSHSLAERVRREKISERMKLLQDLVPGCNRVTGKALMLDEIINYVQSLQRQVEFLSMKLSTVNPTSELNMGHLLTKDEMQPMYQTMVPTQYGHQNHLQDCITTTMDPLIPPFDHNNNNSDSNSNNNNLLHLSSIDGFSNCLSQPQSLCFEDLQSIVQMGFGQDENGYQSQILHGTKTREMKIEL